tara:strand:+ start:63 stop:1556 length:1494 start_codon:yes stop_codon:yes gene_type:complete
MITKSNFVVGQECQRCFWFKYNGFEDPNLKDDQALQRLKDGEEVGERIKDTFNNGVEIPFLRGNYQEMHDLTLEAITNGVKVIFEGSFFVDGVFVRVDIMSKSSNGWDIFEVKSSSGLKEVHKEDASIQWFVLNQIKSLKLNDIYVITLDKSYKRKKELDLSNVFKHHLLTEDVKSKQIEISQTLENLKKISSMDSPPDERISGHHNKNQKCSFEDHCWPKGKDNINSVFKLYRMRSKKKFKLYDQGIDTFEKIENISDFSNIQQIQIKSTLSNTPFIDKKFIEGFISQVTYPISYFDFETYSEPFPNYIDQTPNEKIPFQYSLHVQKNPNDSLDDVDHYEYLASHDEDPRRVIAESMLKNIPEEGSIITYHQIFEKGVIKDLSIFCPDLSDKLLDLNNRILDLKDPFAKGGYYHPDFGGSFSIKKVLPALYKNNTELNYKNLKISNGGMASSAFRELKYNDDNQIKEIRDSLLKYCWLDTYAMIAIYKKLLLIVDT